MTKKLSRHTHYSLNSSLERLRGNVEWMTTGCDTTYQIRARRFILALTRKARKISGARDRWQCQGLGGVCLTALEFNLPIMARFQDGYMVTLAHFPDTHHLSGVGYHDPNPRNARVLDTICHATEELFRKNPYGARKLLDMGVYKIDYVQSGVNQIYLTLDELEAIAMSHHGKLSTYRKIYGLYH